MELPFGIGSATHLLEPRIGWALLAKSTVSKNPVFIPQTAFPQQRVRELTLDNVTLDPADRLESGTLGEYALYFGNGFMIHGTLYERLLGRAVSHGCIRVGRDDLRKVWANARVGMHIYIY